MSQTSVNAPQEHSVDVHPFPTPGSLLATTVNGAVIADAERLSDRFQNAAPFRHICVDSFLREDVAGGLIEDFPPFRLADTKAEHGGVGAKLVRQQLSQYGPAYRQMAALFGSEEFLAWLSKVTGIPDLLWGGESMYGGGTHDNIDGAELDPHVDFNYDDRTRLHRRLNALIFLNREWESAWGGQSEISENPWDPDNKNVKLYDPIWNRLVLFETTEHSWHGFPRIKLPADKKHLSRKSLASYFYTKTRPANEIFGGHATFYVQRHIPETVKAGQILTEEDERELRHIVRKRDTFLRLKQKRESELGAINQRQRSQIERLEAGYRLPAIGFWAELGRADGVYSDNLIGPAATTRFEVLRPASRVRLSGSMPGTTLPGSEIEVSFAGSTTSATFNPGQAVELELPVNVTPGIETLVVKSPGARSGKEAGISGDQRKVGLRIRRIILE